MRSMLVRLRHVRRRILVHRRPLAALSAAAAVLVALQAASAAPPATVPVWTASHDLSSGTVLAASDLARTAFAPGSVPAHALRSRSDAVGRTLAAPLRRGEPLTDVHMVDRRFLAGYPGLAVVPVRITDPGVVAMLRVGDRVTLIAANPQASGDSRTIANNASVVALPPGSSGSPDSGLPGRLVLVAVPATDARFVAEAGVSGYITAVWTASLQLSDSRPPVNFSEPE